VPPRTRRIDPARVREALRVQLERLQEAESPPTGDVDRLSRACVAAVVTSRDRAIEPHPDTVRVAVSYLLQSLADLAPGRSVEVRVPPYAAIQCVAGPRHKRGTPPNVVETDPFTWIDIATGRLSWAGAVETGSIRASGERANLSAFFPLFRVS
jgi:hypothetical protein